jgi:DNA-binding MarR family transcriptional regulator
VANKDFIKQSDMATDRKAIALLTCIAQEYKVEMTRRIEPYKLSLLQLQLLHELSYADKGRLTVNELKARMIDENPNVSRTLNKLMDAGYIRKDRSREDQRTVHVSITAAGRKAHTQADEEIQNVSLSLSKKDADQLYRLLSKL